MSDDVSEAARAWASIFQQICSDWIPRQTFNVKAASKPWYNKHLRYLASCRDRLYRRLRASEGPNKCAYLHAYRRVRNLYLSELRASERRYFKQLGSSLLNLSSSERSWWQRAKRACGWSSSQRMHALAVDNLLITSPGEQAEILNSHFQKQCSAFPAAPPHLGALDCDPTQHVSAQPKFVFKPVTPDQVFRMLRQLPNGKATGSDSIPNELLKITASSVSSPLAALFNLSLSQGVFPSDWKKSILSPQPKPEKDLTQPVSYRPIALLSCVSKVFERLVHEQLLDFCLTSGILPDEQFGFLKGRSAEWQLLSVMESWHLARDQRKRVHAVFLDAAKAFDRVDHSILLKTLSAIGVKHTELQWFASYLSDRTIQTRVENSLSAEASITSGVPQGSVLGPLLFLLHFRGIPGASSAVSALFADDTLLYRDDCAGSTSSPCCRLQSDLASLLSWASETNTSFNASKSVEMCLGSSPSSQAEPLFLGGESIPRHEQTIHLGVTICSDLRWTQHLSTLVQKVSPQIALLQRLAYQRKLPPAVLKKFYLSFIRPRLEYCSAVWCGGPATLLKKLERLQLKVARAIAWRQETTYASSSSLLSLLDLSTLAWRRREHSLVRLWQLANGVGPPQLQALLPPAAASRSARTLRSGHSFQFPSVSTSRHLSSFLCTSICSWNALPSSVALSKSVSTFRSALSKHFASDKFNFGL